MGMYGVLCRVSERQLARIQEDERRAGWLLTSSGRLRSKPWRLLSLGKAWDALDKGLAAGVTTGPLANVVHGVDGIAMGPSLSFGRPRYLAPAQVAQCAEALARFSEQTLRDRYFAGEMRGAHGDWGPHLLDERQRDRDEVDWLVSGIVADIDRERDRDRLDALVRLAHEVARFYGKARRRGDGMLMSVF